MATQSDAMGYPLRDIRCPKCDGRAEFHSPFRFVPEQKASREDRSQPFHRWGGWLVFELFPSILTWTPPRSSSQHISFGGNTGFDYWSRGIAKCFSCLALTVTNLDWPATAFWQWAVRGDLLWALNREHANDIYEFINSDSRKPFGRYARNLSRLPKAFQDAKRRDSILKTLSKSLSAN